MIQFDKVKGSIHCAHIYAAEKEANGIDRFYYKIQNQLKKEYSEIEMEAHIKRMQSVLGYNDELIQIIDLPWELFLSFYKDNTGILNHSSEEYQQQHVLRRLSDWNRRKGIKSFAIMMILYLR